MLDLFETYWYFPQNDYQWQPNSFLLPIFTIFRHVILLVSPLFV